MSRSFPHFRRFLLCLFGLLALALIWVVSQPAEAASIYLIPDIIYGSDYSMAVNNGNPVISYRSNQTSEIVLALCTTPVCTTETTIVKPIESVIGSETAVTVIDGNPLVVYSESIPNSYHQLKVAACSDPFCAQSPTITVVQTGAIWGFNVTVWDGKPLIVYEEPSSDTAHNVLNLVICHDAICNTPPTIQRFSATDGVNGNAGLGMVVSNENIVIGYENDGKPMLLLCTLPNCSEPPLIKTVDPHITSVWGLSLAVIDQTAVMSYAGREIERPVNWLKLLLVLI